MTSKYTKYLLTLALCVTIAACGGEERKSLRVGAKPFAESLILAEMIAQMAENAGIPVERNIPYGLTPKLMEAVKQDFIDVYPEYNGTSLTFLGQAPTADGNASTERVQALFKPLGLEMTGKFGFSNDYALVMTRERAKELGVSTIQNLTNVSGFTYVVDDDFVQRPADGLQQMNRRYGINGANVVTHPGGTEGKDKIVSALLNGSADVGELFMTDGQIAEYDLVVLEDNLNFFPVYDVAPLVRSDALANIPGLSEVLQSLAGQITSADMQAMNKAVDLDAQSPASVAASFLASKGLLPEDAKGSGAAKITVVADPGVKRNTDTARALRAIRSGYAGSDLDLVNDVDPLGKLASGEARVAIVGAESFYSLTEEGPVSKGNAEAFAVVGYKSGHLLGVDNGTNSLDGMTKIATGPKGSGASIVLNMLLNSIGKAGSIDVVNSDDSTRELLLGMTSMGAAQGGHDGVFLMAPSKDRVIAGLMRSGFYKLIDLTEWAEGGHTARFSFIRPTTIPANTYPQQDKPITTVSTQLVLASPAIAAKSAGDVGPGTVGSGSDAAVPVSASAVASIREALGTMDVVDPAIPVHSSLLPKIVVVDKALPFSADVSIINILMILFTIWVGYLVTLPSPRNFKMPEDN